VCQILWEGSIHIDKLDWKLSNTQISDLLDYQKILDHRDLYWNELKSKHDVYNGYLLGVTDFIGNSFKCFTYSFKDHITISRFGITLPRYLGNLGFKIHVISPDGTRTVLGRRSHSIEYLGGWITTIGGMFELSDIEGTIADAVLRELHEESGIVKDDLDWTSFRLISIMKEINGLAVDLIVEISLQNEVELVPNDEWESLYWTMIDDIKIDNSTMLHINYLLP